MLLTTFHKGQHRAEIHQNSEGYYIDYYGPSGIKMKTEYFQGESIQKVAIIAENWVPNTQVLNG